MRFVRGLLLLLPFLFVLAIGCGGGGDKAVVPSNVGDPPKDKPKAATALS